MIDSIDDLTILRFTHSFKSGGGVEQHLDALDNALLKRNRVRIIRLYLEKEFKGNEPEILKIGRGTLIKIPLPLKYTDMPSNNTLPKADSNFTISNFKKNLMDLVLYNPFLYRRFFGFRRTRYAPGPGIYEIIDAGEYAKKILRSYKIDLLVMHSAGTRDSATMIEEAKMCGLPFIYVNHFANSQLNNISVIDQLIEAAAIAGVSNSGVPWDMRRRFYNVSSGIDLEMFNPERAVRPEFETNAPIILHPARIVKEKGQIDLIKACAELRRRGMRTKLVFAGRSDSAEYEQLLRKYAAEKMPAEDVIFLGELSLETLRNWYGISAIVAFPTYHNEGLPRIIMEAQAMKLPPVGYIIGGTPKALIDGKTGFVVPSGDIAALTDRLACLLASDAKRKDMGEKGREFVLKNFGLNALAARHEHLYVSVLSKINSYNSACKH
jgi:glycosyltransferase involved in cell wall biosynthesis